MSLPLEGSFFLRKGPVCVTAHDIVLCFSAGFCMLSSDAICAWSTEGGVYFRIRTFLKKAEKVKAKIISVNREVPL